MPERFTSPVGRLVQGSAFEAQTKDQQGNPRVIKTGPNAGQPNPQFFIAVAFRKDDPAWPAFWAILDRVGRTEWPTLFPVPGQPCVNPKFTFKVLDGDGVDTNGKSNAAKEGFAGHWVVRFASSFPPKVFHVGHYQPHEQVTDKMALQRGYYVRVNGSAAGNKNPTNPGLYVNVDMIEIAGYGAVIVSGPDATEAFSAPSALPPGASATPVAGPATTAPPPAAAPVRQMLPAAEGATYESLIAAGWTDELLVQHGKMAPAPAPYSGYREVAPAGPPAAPAAPPPAAPPLAPAPVGPQMTAAATNTYDQYKAAGWTDDQLRAGGLMV